MGTATRQRTLALLDALLGGPAPAQGRLGLEVQALREHERWTSDKRIIGYGFPGKGGYYSTNKSTAKVALYVDQDDSVAALADDVPSCLQLPGLDAPLDTEIINLGEVRPLANPLRLRPLVCGSSISNINTKSGTLGAIVSRKDEPESQYILSNNHVLVEYNNFRDGDPIIQPGSSDKGKSGDKVAELSHAVPLVYGDRGYPNFVDAALGRIVADGCLSASHDTKPTAGILRHPRRGELVRIYGRSSSMAVGQIMDVSARLAMWYPRDAKSSSRVGFADVVLCTPFSRAGDSGALVLSESGKALGIIIGGSSKVSIFCKIGYLVEMLRIDNIRVIQ